MSQHVRFEAFWECSFLMLIDVGILGMMGIFVMVLVDRWVIYCYCAVLLFVSMVIMLVVS